MGHISSEECGLCVSQAKMGGVQKFFACRVFRPCDGRRCQAEHNHSHPAMFLSGFTSHVLPHDYNMAALPLSLQVLSRLDGEARHIRPQLAESVPVFIKKGNAFQDLL